MSRGYRPDLEALVGALATRLDALETQVGQISGDVGAIGRALAELTATIRTLTAVGPTGTAGPVPVDQGAGQPDWFAVNDPQQARDVLTGLTGLVAQVLAHHGIGLPTPCWPLHPTVVADLLALASERDAAYTGAKPTPVSEWLTRWLPATAERITDALRPCATERGHREGGRTYDLTGFDPLSAGTWWALDRHIPPARAFALPPL